MLGTHTHDACMEACATRAAGQCMQRLAAGILQSYFADLSRDSRRPSVLQALDCPLLKQDHLNGLHCPTMHEIGGIMIGKAQL